MNFERSTPIDEMNAGELENALHARQEASIGGSIYVGGAILLVIVSWFMNWTVAYWFFAILAGLFWLFAYSIRRDIDKIKARLNEVYGGDNE